MASIFAFRHVNVHNRKVGFCYVLSVSCLCFWLKGYAYGKCCAVENKTDLFLLKTMMRRVAYVVNNTII